jgi:Mn-dependent DtxR family transcriptional regulator
LFERYAEAGIRSTQHRPPAEADMQRYFKVTAPSVHQMVLTLERNGLVKREPGVPRSIEILLAPEALPILR